jgi:hypothetical protein
MKEKPPRAAPVAWTDADLGGRFLETIDYRVRRREIANAKPAARERTPARPVRGTELAVFGSL